MKIADIRKMNNDIITEMDQKKFVFFKNLYAHCVSVLDTIPESYIKEILEEANKLRVIMYKVHFYRRLEKTYVAFCGETPNEYEYERRYTLDESTFDFHDVEVSFDFEDEATIRFYDTESIFDMETLKRVFGENLLKADCDIYEVSVKCFE